MNPKFLDQTDIFTLLYNGNVSATKQLFKDKFELYKKGVSNQELKGFLYSLNLGIYHFILFYEHISLDECCCRNHRTIRESEYSHTALCQIGLDLIHSYGYCTDYLISRYQNMYIRHAIKHIHQNLSQYICLEQLAKHVGLSKNQLCFLFKNETGRTISSYVTERRIIMAKELLQKGNLSMDLIAECCGFSSTSYFCVIFKKGTGQTPLQFRKSKNGAVTKRLKP